MKFREFIHKMRIFFVTVEHIRDLLSIQYLNVLLGNILINKTNLLLVISGLSSSKTKKV